LALAVILSTGGQFSRADLRGGGRDSTQEVNHGLIFDLGVEPHYPSVSSHLSPLVTLGVGYELSRRLTFSMRFITGSENIGQQPTRPVWGTLRIGGADLDATLFLRDERSLCPYVSLGFGLYTVETRGGEGYNGSGEDIAVGVQALLLQYFAINLSMTYRSLRFYNIVGDTDPTGIFEPFHDHTVGMMLSITFFPSILP
jgi:hypothetical protein